MVHKVLICGVDTSTLPKLNAAETEIYLKKISNGDTEAKEYFILANLRLVLSMVQRFNGRDSGDDLFQVGCVGLMKAVNNFDVKYGVRFSTYAVPMIIGEIRRFLKGASSIKVSRSMRDVAYKALSTRERMEKELCRTVPMMEVAEEIDVPFSEVACALDAVSEPVSLYETVVNDGDDSMMLMEQICDGKCNDEVWTNHMVISEAIKLLPEKERNVLVSRYFVGRTQTEISEDIGISQAQVSRLEKNAIKKIRDYYNA